MCPLTHTLSQTQGGKRPACSFPCTAPPVWDTCAWMSMENSLGSKETKEGRGEGIEFRQKYTCLFLFFSILFFLCQGLTS